MTTVPCFDGVADWYHYGQDGDFFVPPLRSASPPPLASLSAVDYRLPIAAPPPTHLSRSNGELVGASAHGALAAATAAGCSSSSALMMNLREDEGYYDLPMFPPFSTPLAGGDLYCSDQLPPVPADYGATAGLDDALLLPLGDIDLEAFDNADERKPPPPHLDHAMIVPAEQRAVVCQEHGGVDDVVYEEQKPMGAISGCFRPPGANAFDMIVSHHHMEEQEAETSVVTALVVPPPPPSLPRPRGRRIGDHHRHRSSSSPAAAGKTRLDHIGFDGLRKYFYMPITRAAREMNVGLTVLKKRCRELGIARWPHRKMKSLKSLILNVQEMGSGMNPAAVQQELEALETYCALMEENPAIELTERTKKLRQACFKESYKRRRAAAVNMMDHILNFDHHQYHHHHHQLPPPPSSSAEERHGEGSGFFAY